MADINRDLDRYLRRKRENDGVVTSSSWFDQMFSSAEEKERLTPPERKSLERVERDIEHTEQEVAIAHELEEHLEEEQERKVGFYHNLMRFFQRREEPRETIELHDVAPAEDLVAKEDFRELARIYTVWLSRLPTRIRDEFKESEDYAKMSEILQRRGIAKRK